ncbi:hypothetical protein NJ76_10630 [Rhodococcus sp. IITR03]|nr:hypothetical protein NJ76_10630 [Rhodococcus sp. IITR03]
MERSTPCAREERHGPGGRAVGEHPSVFGGRLPQPGDEFVHLAVGLPLQGAQRRSARDAGRPFGGEDPARAQSRIGPRIPFGSDQHGAAVEIEGPGLGDVQSHVLEQSPQRGQRVVREMPVPQGVPLSLRDDGGEGVELQQQHTVGGQ